MRPSAKTVVVAFSHDERTEVKRLSKAEELNGKLASQMEEDKLMKSVLQNDKSKLDEGRMLNEAINQGLVAFTPDLMMSQIVKNYRMAESLYGEKLVKLLTGYSPDYLRKNINIPEFNRELQLQMKQRLDQLKEDGLVGADGQITKMGLSLASFVMYVEELDRLMPKGWRGERIHKKTSHYGEPSGSRIFRKGDRYKDVSIRETVRLAIRRKHKTLLQHDLKTFERQAKGLVYVMYGLDASGSMKGEKIEMAKKAGIALAHSAIMNKDKAGLIVFGSQVKDSVAPTDDLKMLVENIVKVRASRETDFTEMIKKAIELFPVEHVTKHLILLTDALPTVGQKPEEDTMESVSMARAAGITISIVGVSLDAKGKTMAEKIVRLGDGRLYGVRNLKDMDKIVIEDYQYAVGA
ncbi:MAG: VWA domain-containing protein [Nanoarchaeota archaeon]